MAHHVEKYRTELFTDRESTREDRILSALSALHNSGAVPQGPLQGEISEFRFLLQARICIQRGADRDVD